VKLVKFVIFWTYDLKYLHYYSKEWVNPMQIPTNMARDYFEKITIIFNSFSCWKSKFLLKNGHQFWNFLKIFFRQFVFWPFQPFGTLNFRPKTTILYCFC
jgi:hypothetical protein